MKLKSAFSLIEVLMVMGIISVIMIMGFSISKKGVDSAYNIYWYTGYKALTDASFDAVIRGVFDPHNLTSDSLCKYTDYIGLKLMKAPEDSYECNSNSSTFQAPNGISYEVIKGSNYYSIIMSIPKHKQKNTAPFTTIFVYNFEKGLIYPANITATATKINLHNRMDILPFYVNKGEQQIVINKLYGFRDAYCETDDSITEGESELRITCPTSSSTKKYGVITPINPRKVF